MICYASDFTVTLGYTLYRLVFALGLTVSLNVHGQGPFAKEAVAMDCVDLTIESSFHVHDSQGHDFLATEQDAVTRCLVCNAIWSKPMRRTRIDSSRSVLVS